MTVRRIRLVALFALLALAGLYAGDYLSARYRIPGNRQTLGSVEVQTFYAVRQKDGRIEYVVGDSDAETCIRSLFPQLGYTPCWYLSRHAIRRIEVSRAGQFPNGSRGGQALAEAVLAQGRRWRKARDSVSC